MYRIAACALVGLLASGITHAAISDSDEMWSTGVKETLQSRGVEGSPVEKVDIHHVDAAPGVLLLAGNAPCNAEKQVCED